MPLAKINDIEMYYEVHGDGEPLLVIQGMGVDLSVADSFNQKLGESFRVIAFDNRGAGRSGKPDIPYTIDMMVRDTLGLMDHLHIQKANILGSSMGSMIAIALAADHPGRVNHLILHVAFHRVAQPLKCIWTIMWNLSWGQRKMISMSDLLFKQKYPPTPESFVRQGKAPLTFDGRNLLPRIQAPVLILNGSRDQVVPMRITRELAAGIPGARLIVSDGDHLFGAMNPDLIIEPTVEFLNRNHS